MAAHGHCGEGTCAHGRHGTIRAQHTVEASHSPPRTTPQHLSAQRRWHMPLRQPSATHTHTPTDTITALAHPACAHICMAQTRRSGHESASWESNHERTAERWHAAQGVHES